MSRTSRGALKKAKLVHRDYNWRSGKTTNQGEVQADKMAHGFKSRDDPEYIAFIEDKFLEVTASRDRDSETLKTIVSRLDRMEDSSKSQPTGRGRGILRTPLKTSPHVGRPSYIGGELLGDEPSAADLVNGPLTQVLQQLSIAIDPTPQSSTKGLLLRPEYYIQHVDKGMSVKSLDHTKLTFKELMSGMGRVMLHLTTTGGDLTAYIRHFNFLAKQASCHNFTDAAFIGYDRHVVDQVIQGSWSADNPHPTFVAGDTIGVSSNFHAGNMVPVTPQFVRGRGRGRGFQRRGGRYPFSPEAEKDPPSTPHSVPSDFPDDLCFSWNYRVCTGKCSKSHVCRICRGSHKAPSCPSPKK